MKRFTVLIVLLFLIAVDGLFGQDRFLTYPFEWSAKGIVRAGWYYPDYQDEYGVWHYCEMHAPNGAIDFDESVGGQQTSFNVITVASGEVILNQWSDTYGWWVILKHLVDGNTYFTAYAHLDVQSQLSVGIYIARGDYIGSAGTTGNSSGVHLHFEVRKYNGTGTATWSSSVSVDPYDKRLRADGKNCATGTWGTAYPDPHNGPVGRMGNNYLWTSDPPVHYNVGCYAESPSWHDESHPQPSLPFADAYNRHPNKIGQPNDNGGGTYVHEWYGKWIQDFYKETGECISNTRHTAIVLNPNPQTGEKSAGVLVSSFREFC